MRIVWQVMLILHDVTEMFIKPFSIGIKIGPEWRHRVFTHRTFLTTQGGGIKQFELLYPEEGLADSSTSRPMGY